MTILLTVGSLASGGMIIYLLLDRREHVLRDYVLLGLFGSILSMISYLLELRGVSLDAKLTAVKFGYLGKLFITPIFICFVLRYYETAVHWIWKFLLFVPGVAMQAFILTLDQNDYYYKSVSLTEKGMLQIEPGSIYYISMMYSLSMTAVFLSICLYQRKKLDSKAKRLNTILLLSSGIPCFCLFTYLLGLTHAFDPTPLGIMVGSLLVAYSILKYGLLNKDAMLQNMTTGLIFLDADNHLIYANPAAYHILPILESPNFRKNEHDLGALFTDAFATIQVGMSIYQRKLAKLETRDSEHGTLVTYDDVTEINERLNRDAMTGLLNHASFYQTLEHEMKIANEQNKTLCVAIADIDSFKAVNDSFGHANGDIILIALAHLMEDVCKGMDVFRYGGEEFAVIFTCDYDTAEASMRKTLSRFSSMRFKFLDKPVTFSYGTAQYNGTENAVDLFDRADQLMYIRKKELHRREREQKQ